jgi:hypothetical protein
MADTPLAVSQLLLLRHDSVPDGSLVILLQQFDALLKEVVTAKRLSGSKVQQLTDMAKKLMKVSCPLVFPFPDSPQSSFVLSFLIARCPPSIIPLEDSPLPPSQIHSKDQLPLLLRRRLTQRREIPHRQGSQTEG